MTQSARFTGLQKTLQSTHIKTPTHKSTETLDFYPTAGTLPRTGTTGERTGGTKISGIITNKAAVTVDLVDKVLVDKGQEVLVDKGLEGKVLVDKGQEDLEVKAVVMHQEGQEHKVVAMPQEGQEHKVVAMPQEGQEHKAVAMHQEGQEHKAAAMHQGGQELRAEDRHQDLHRGQETEEGRTMSNTTHPKQS